MPFALAKISKFFKKSSNFLLKDYCELVTMSRKYGFAKKSLTYFTEQMNESGLEELDAKIFLDNEYNFQNGIQLFCLTALVENQILIMDIFTSNFYWGTASEFYINYYKYKTEVNADHSKIIEKNSMIPDSFKVLWFLSGSVHNFFCDNEDFFPFLENFQQKEFQFSR